MRAWGLALIVASGVAGCIEPATVVIEPLRVIFWSPESGSICIGVDTEVRAVFSDDLDPATLSNETFLLHDPDGVTIESEVTYDEADHAARLTPVAPLDLDVVYTVVVGEDVAGLKDGRLPVEQSATFHTVAPTGCGPSTECSLNSDCPGSQLCSGGICIDECVADDECESGTCVDGSCQ